MKMMMMAITMKMKRTMMGVKMTTIEVVVPGATMKMMRKEAVKAKKKERAI
jgi:hypothetical protein